MVGGARGGVRCVGCESDVIGRQRLQVSQSIHTYIISYIIIHNQYIHNMCDACIYSGVIDNT